MMLTRAQHQAILRIHANEKIAHALHSIQPLLEQHKLQWHDHGRNPDCQFTSFIHASQKTIPLEEDILLVRRTCKSWLSANPPSHVESMTAWHDNIKAFGFGNIKIRKQGDDDSLCGLAGVFKTRINVIVVMTTGHHIQHFNPPENIQHLDEVWLIYMNLENISHYLSTTPEMDITIPPPPHPPITRGANGSSARTRRATSSTELTDFHTATAVGSSSRVSASAPAALNPIVSQEVSQVSPPSTEDIFENIQHVQGDFVDCLIQNGALKFLQ